jgi:PadR family transcriptional regulator PadR
MVATEAANQRDSDLLRGVLDMCVLATLATRPAHAYELVERLRGLGFDAVSYGTVYPLVTRLRRQGLLEQASVASPIGPNRKVLAITASGRASLAQWRTSWEETTAVAARVMAELDQSQAGARS